ncbi:hypothetical protein OO014_08835 [Intrasporangium calvum]|uniref:ATP synthase protein I n=1 Tax=Intrasporangium calvum TaxID=53358 RepID=A0ABT5GGZ0_9MICO|nr:hypothetical protein [Intrasporangium calvum]MDC5697359.1 hypothetical protein [Intrasporangium calvum]
MRTSQSRTGAPSPVRSMLRTSLAFSAVSVPVITLGAWLLRGSDGVASGLLGAVVAVAFFVVGAQGMRAVIAGDAGLSMAGALVVYIGQLIALVAVFLALRGAEWLDGRAFAAAAIIQTLVWQVGQVVGFRRGRHEIYPDVTLPSGS